MLKISYFLDNISICPYNNFMETNFLLTQIFGFIALIIVGLSYFQKNKERFLFLQIIANFFYATAFLFQNLLVAGIGTYISLFRAFGLYYISKCNKEPPLQYLFIIFACYFINTSLFYSSPVDLIPLITSCIFSIAFFIKDMGSTRFLMIIPNIALCCYNFTFLCYTSSILDGIETFIATVSYITFKHSARKKAKFV